MGLTGSHLQMSDRSGSATISVVPIAFQVPGTESGVTQSLPSLSVSAGKPYTDTVICPLSPHLCPLMSHCSHTYPPEFQVCS